MWWILIWNWFTPVWTIVRLNYVRLNYCSFELYGHDVISCFSSNQLINCSFELLISKFSFELLPFEPLFVWTIVIVQTLVRLNYCSFELYWHDVVSCYISNQHINCSFELLISKFSFKIFYNYNEVMGPIN